MSIRAFFGKLFHARAERKALTAIDPPPDRRDPTDELSRLAGIIKRALGEPERKLLAGLYRGDPDEVLCSMFSVNVDQLKSNMAHARQRFRELVARHGFDQSRDPQVQKFLRRTYGLLAR